MITRAMLLDSTIAGPVDLTWFDTKMAISVISPLKSLLLGTVKQAGGFIFLDELFRANNLYQLRDNRLPTSVPASKTQHLITNTTKMVLSLCPLFPQGSNERETLRQFVHFLPQLLHAAGLRHQDVESSSA